MCHKVQFCSAHFNIILYQHAYNVVGIETRLRAEKSRLRIPARARDFSVLQTRPGYNRSPRGLVFSGYWGSFLRVKRWKREAGNPLRPGTEVKNERRYTSIPPLCLLRVYRKDFTFISFTIRILYRKRLIRFLIMPEVWKKYVFSA